MPELPEVETVARQLAPRLTGRVVRRVAVLDPRLRTAPTPSLAGRRILGVRRSGKRVLVELSPRPAGGAPLFLAVHLRMTGRLLWVEDGRPHPRAHLRARFGLDRGRLLFVDPRRFGTFAWYLSAGAAEPAAMDPLAPELTPDRLERLIDGSRQNLKAWLLRQDRLVGLGNIYASEILHHARLSPLRGAGSLDRAELRRLHLSLRRILERAIRSGGTTLSDFADASGESGSYQHRLAVYDREGEPCRRCRGTILRLVQQQRSTYHCPSCQT